MAAIDPRVSFIVPCYKLAHLLPECVNSILTQSFQDFEILIMDDCSPDNTQQVATSFEDSRIRYVRNEKNLGHLRNYNKGIHLTRGRYLWLISADDYLRRPYVLEHYVRMLNEHPKIGYVFCPGVKVINGKEQQIIGYSCHGGKNAIFNGHKFLSKLVMENTIVAASGCARKECYEKVSEFPLDMPWGGDWYLWGLFAFYYDVGYLAEPMVCYREHGLSMTSRLMKEDIAQCSSEDIAMPWIFKRKAEEFGDERLVRTCLESAAREYGRCFADRRYKGGGVELTLEQFEASLRRNTPREAERDFVRARVYGFIADSYYWRGQHSQASQLYAKCLQKDFWRPKVWAKRLLLSTGLLGRALRGFRSSLIRRFSRDSSAAPRVKL